MDSKLFLFCSCLVVAALITGSAALTDNDKHVFVFAFMNISLDDPNLPVYQEIFLGTMWNQSHFRVEVPMIGTDFRDEVRYKDPIVPQFVEQVTSRNLNDDDALTTQTVFNALRVTADHRINIQAAKATQGSTDGMLVLPLTATSKEFFIPSFDNIPLGHSTFLIVSPYKDTCVEASYVNGTDVRRIFFRSLGEFEVFQTYSEIEDYTGVFVSATRPIAVLGGHECSQIPVVKKFCDHIVEQVPPIDEWGWQFVMGPIIGRQYQAGYTIRVIAGYMNTTIDVITHNGGTDSYFKHRGDFMTVDIPDARSIVTVKCSEKCLVAQYNKGYRAFSNVDTVTDPFMTLITPNDHLTNRMTFTTARLWDTMGTVPFINYLTVVAPIAAASGIILNDRPIATVFGNTASWTTGVDGQWAVVSFGVDPDNYTMYHPDDNVKFVGYLYGHGGVEPTGYGYATGYAIHGDPVPEEDFDFTFTTEPPVVTVAPGTCSTNRPLPPASVKGPNQRFSVSGDFKYPARTTECKVKYKEVLRPKPNDLKDLINYLICIGQMCPNTQYTQIEDLIISEYEENQAGHMVAFDVDVSMVTGQGEAMRDLLICKRQVIAALQQPSNWNMPIQVQGCDEVDLGLLEENTKSRGLCPRTL